VLGGVDCPRVNTRGPCILEQWGTQENVVFEIGVQKIKTANFKGLPRAQKLLFVLEILTKAASFS
jgi:hypothetical protein